MENELKKLLDYLTKELTYYKSLLNYSKQKNKALIDNNIEDISVITLKEEKLVSKIRDLEKQRIELLKNIAAQNKIEISELNITKLSELINNEKLKTELLKTKDLLNDCLNELRKLNDQNTEMIKQTLEIINHSLKTVTVTAADPQVYNKNKQEQKTKNQQSFLFDKKI